MQRIIPHLWFDKEAREAAEFHVSAFGGDSAVTSTTPLSDTPSGDVEVVSFRLLGHEFMSISAGPLFSINPSISFMVNFDPSQRADAKPALDALWQKLTDGGTALMPLDTYPFSERYGWIQDTDEAFPVYHFCFRVSPQDFDAILGRIKAAGIKYRSTPDGAMDMQINKRYGNIYWDEPDGHRWEILTVSYARQTA